MSIIANKRTAKVVCSVLEADEEGEQSWVSPYCTLKYQMSIKPKGY